MSPPNCQGPAGNVSENFKVGRKVQGRPHPLQAVLGGDSLPCLQSLGFHFPFLK